MICKNCGNQLSEGTAFCGVCGVKIEDAPVSEPEASVYEAAAPTDTTKYEEAEATAPADTAQYEQKESVAPTYINDGAVNEPAPKKKSKKWLFVAIPVLAVVLAVVLCFNTLTGFFVKNFGSNASYFAYVEGTSLSGYSNTVTSLYGVGKSNIVNGGGAEGEMAIELGDTLTTMLSGYANGMDLSWLKQIKIKIDADTVGTKSSGTLALVLGEKTVLNAEYILDNEKGVAYLRCKELSDKFIKFEIPNMSGSAFTAMSTVAANSASSSALNNIYDLMEYSPSEEELDKLFKKYIDIVLKQVTDDDVTKEAGEITANGITQNCTVLKLNITDKLLLNVVKAVLTEAKNDKEIIAIIERFEKGIKEISEIEGNAVEEYKKGIDDALENVDETIAELEGNGKEYFSLIDYVNGSHEIIGREVALNGTTALSILSAENGKDIGYEFSVAGKLSFTGKAQKNGEAVTGDFSLVVEGKEIITISTENLASDIENTTLSGAIVLRLGKDVKDLMDSSAYTTLSLLDLSLRLEFESSADKALSSFAVLSGEKIFVKLSVNSKTTEAIVADAPADGEIISSDEIEISDLDLAKVIDNLKEAGVPQNLLTILQYAAMAG